MARKGCTRKAPFPGYLYVMKRSDGMVKVGRTNNVASRIAGHKAQTNNKGIKFSVCWVSAWRDDIDKAEKRLLLDIGTPNRRGGPRVETLAVSVQQAIAAAKRAMR